MKSSRQRGLAALVRAEQRDDGADPQIVADRFQQGGALHYPCTLSDL